MTQSPLLAPPRVVHGDNPFAVDPELDRFAVPPTGDPLWSETMMFAAWSPQQQVGVWVHCGVQPTDKSLWWVHTFVLLPAGVVVANLSHNRLPQGDVGQRMECIEPLRKWRVTFEGTGTATSTDQLAAAGLNAGPAVPFHFDIEFEGVVPVYDLHSALGTDTKLQRGLHHEQGCLARGTLTAMGDTWQLDGPGVRDHSVGQRNFTTSGGHVWNYTVWPESRRALSVLSVWLPTTQEVALCAGMLMGNGTTEITSDFDISGVTAPGGHPRELALRFNRADGSAVELTGTTVHNVTVTYADPNLNFMGNHGGPQYGLADALVADESVVEWAWPDGEIGLGIYERARRMSSGSILHIPLPAQSPFHSRRGPRR